MVEGMSGLLAVARRQRVRVKWEPSLGELTWPQGQRRDSSIRATIRTGCAGPSIISPGATSSPNGGRPMRAGTICRWGCAPEPRPRALVTTTPRPMPLLERIRGDHGRSTTGGRTKDNVSLPKQFIEVMMATYGGTRLGRQELDGELMAEAEGSLWPRAS